MPRSTRSVASTPSDDGFTLLEAVLAGLVLFLFAAGVFATIATTLRVSQTDRKRVAATQLAGREMEITRNAFRSGDAAVLALIGQGTATNANPTGGAGPSVVDGVAYSVERTADWLAAGTGTSPCDGGAAVTYPAVSVHIEVTWPNMGAVTTVVDDSIVTPNKTLVNSVSAFVAVKVVNYAGVPQTDRPVSVSGPSGTYSVQTDDSGCAVFGLGTTGDHVFGLNEPGYVDAKSTAPAQQTVTATAGSFKQVQFTWAASTTLATSIFAPSGYALPVTLPSLSVYNTGLPATGTPTYSRTFAASSFPYTNLTGLGPYSNGLTVYAGGCSDALPTVAPTNGTVSNVVTPAGGTSLTAVVLGALAVTGPPNVQVTATKSGSTCASAADQTIVLGTTNALGKLNTSLPYGNWTLSRPGGGASAVVHAVQGPDTVANPATTVVVP